MPFEFRPGPIEGLVVIVPRSFPDDRGYFMESYKRSEFIRGGIDATFVQDNHSLSGCGVVRGLHFQREPKAQGKLVRVTKGRAWDVAVDLRKGSGSYGTWAAVELSGTNKHMLYIPPGFAHGFQALEEGTELLYKCTAEYDAASDGGIRWDDPDVGIAWPLEGAIVSPKDMILPALKDIAG